MVTLLQIQTLLSQRGKTGTLLVDYTLVDNSDGAGAHVDVWNVAALGAIPTQGEIDAITPAQLAATLAAQKTAAFAATSRQKDILATIALVVRAKGLAAWNAMTTAQKVTATLAEADAWTTIRDFIEANVP
jgi:hypothetical protein